MRPLFTNTWLEQLCKSQVTLGLCRACLPTASGVICHLSWSQILVTHSRVNCRWAMCWLRAGRASENSFGKLLIQSATDEPGCFTCHWLRELRKLIGSATLTRSLPPLPAATLAVPTRVSSAKLLRQWSQDLGRQWSPLAPQSRANLFVGLTAAYWHRSESKLSKPGNIPVLTGRNPEDMTQLESHGFVNES